MDPLVPRRHVLGLLAAAPWALHLLRPPCFPDPRVLLVVLEAPVPRKDLAAWPIGTALRARGTEATGVRLGRSSGATLRGEVLRGLSADDPGFGAAPTLPESLRRELSLPVGATWIVVQGAADAPDVRPSGHPEHGDASTCAIGTSGLALGARLLGAAKLTRPPSETVLPLVPSDGSGLTAEQRLALDEVVAATTEDLARNPGPTSEALAAIRITEHLLTRVAPVFTMLALESPLDAPESVLQRALLTLLDTATGESQRRQLLTLLLHPIRDGANGSSGTLFGVGLDIEANKTSRSTVNPMDVAPTVCRLLKARAPLAKGKAIRAFVR